MNVKRASILLFLICSFCFSSDVFAEKYAWLIDRGGGNATLIDLIGSSIIKEESGSQLHGSIELTAQESVINIDIGADLLYLIFDYPGRHTGQGVRVLNLNDLSLMKNLELYSFEPDYELPKIVSPPGENIFYVIWWDKAKAQETGDGTVYDVFSKGTFEKIETLSSFPINIYQSLWFSSDNTRIYSMTFDASEIKVFDAKTLNLKETLQTNHLWSDGVSAKAAEYYSEDAILLVEAFNSNDPVSRSYKYFTYNIINKSISQKVNVPESGFGLLLQGANKIAIIEVLPSGATTNKIYVYDLESGEKTNTIDLSNTYTELRIFNGNFIDSEKTILYLKGVTKAGQNVLLTLDFKSVNPIVSEFPNIHGSWIYLFDK